MNSAVTRETPDSDNDATCAELKADEGWKKSVNKSRPASIASEPENNKWISIVSGIEKTKMKCQRSSRSTIHFVHAINQFQRAFTDIHCSTFDDGLRYPLHLRNG